MHPLEVVLQTFLSSRCHDWWFHLTKEVPCLSFLRSKIGYSLPYIVGNGIVRSKLCFSLCDIRFCFVAPRGFSPLQEIFLLLLKCVEILWEAVDTSSDKDFSFSDFFCIFSFFRLIETQMLSWNMSPHWCSLNPRLSELGLAGVLTDRC